MPPIDDFALCIQVSLDLDRHCRAKRRIRHLALARPLHPYRAAVGGSIKQYGIESRLPWVKFCEDVAAERTGESGAAQEFLATMLDLRGALSTTGGGVASPRHALLIQRIYSSRASATAWS